MQKKRFIELGVLVLFTLVILGVSRFNRHYENEMVEEDNVADAEPLYEYGIPVDSCYVIKDRVKKNEFLADILLRYGVPYSMIDQFVKKSQPVFDVRRIRAGNTYSVLCTNDSLKQFQVFIYEISPASYIVFDSRDSMHVHRGEKEISLVEKECAGTIRSSLWNAMRESDADPTLAIELSEVYAWVIDFFGLQKGDRFSVVYEAIFIGEEFVGIGKIKSSLFEHAGNSYYAFYFIQDSVGDYFDEEGNSLRRTFLKSPLKYSRISSRFSHSRLHPILKIRRPHHGVDYAAPAGTPVYAIGDGKIITARRSGQSGNMVKIRHNSTYTTAYLHLSGFGKGIREGVAVKQGEVIGYVGSTGLSTGPHLDFRFYTNGQPVDPLKVESPPAEPVDSAHIQAFFTQIEPEKARLQQRNTLSDYAE